MAQIGWVEVATEDGTSGYLWYLKSESETRLRFDDYLEMAMIEGELAAPAGQFAVQAAAGNIGNTGFGAVCCSWILKVFLLLFKQEVTLCLQFSGGTGITTVDAILKNLDTQGAIEENMLFLNRSLDLDFDDMLGQISSGQAGGTAYGLFRKL